MVVLWLNGCPIAVVAGCCAEAMCAVSHYKRIAGFKADQRTAVDSPFFYLLLDFIQLKKVHVK
jgi:hypothetical protein